MKSRPCANRCWVPSAMSDLRIFSISECGFPSSDCGFRIADLMKATLANPNPRFEIRNPQSAIYNPQSDVVPRAAKEVALRPRDVPPGQVARDGFEVGFGSPGEVPIVPQLCEVP